MKKLNVEKPVKNSTSSAKKFMPCRGCQRNIWFDPNQKSRGGKFIPLNQDGSAHSCPNRQRNNASDTSSVQNRQICTGALTPDFLEKFERLARQQEQLKNEVKIGLEHVSQRLNTLQYEIHKQQTSGRP